MSFKNKIPRIEIFIFSICRILSKAGHLDAGNVVGTHEAGAGGAGLRGTVHLQRDKYRFRQCSKYVIDALVKTDANLLMKIRGPCHES